MAVFLREFRKYSHRHPQKALLYPERHQGVGCSLSKEPKKRTKTSHPRGSAKSRIWEAETLKPITTKFCKPRAVQDVITAANFCEDRLRGFGKARGRILAFSIDLLRRHTLALPCECVIFWAYQSTKQYGTNSNNNNNNNNKFI